MYSTEVISMGHLPGGRQTARQSNTFKAGLAALACFTLFSLGTVAVYPALAKDKAPPNYDELFAGSENQHNWAGFYVGASAGYGWGKSSSTYDRNDGNHETAESSRLNGFAPGITLGFNYRFNNNIILGVEGDLGIMDLDAPDQTGLWDGHVWKSQYGGMWGTLRARLGYAFDRTLLYATGGLAMMETSEFILGDNDATQNTYNEGVHTGWVLGAGLEYALTKNITTKLEYLHMEFPEYRGYTNNEESYGFENSVDLVRVGLNYKF